MKKQLLLALVMVFSGLYLQGQVTGIVNIPDQATLDATITALNSTGVGAGGATLNFTAGFNLTGPKQFGSATLNASLSAANPLILQGNGNTLNAAYAGTRAGSTSSGNNDGIFILNGPDYVTIQNFTFTELATNTTTTTAIENAVAIYNRLATTPFDGSQFITISGCNFNLGKAATNGAAIYSGNYIYTGTAALAWATFATDPTQMNRIITVNNNVFNGSYNHVIYRGYSSVNGRGLVVTNNTMNNIGGGATAAYGVYTLYLDSIIVNNNSMSMSTAQTTTIYGQFASTNCGGFMQSNNNNITLASGTTTSQTAGIYLSSTVGGNKEVNGNTVQFGSFPNITSGTIYCLYSTYGGGNSDITFQMNGNSIQNQSLPPTTGTIYGCYNSGSVSATNNRDVEIKNNIINNLTRPNSGTMYCIYGTVSDTTLIENNTVSNITITNNSASGSASVYAIYAPGASKRNIIRNNTVFNITAVGSSTSISGTLRGIYCTGLAAGFAEISGNQINNLSYLSGTHTGDIYGIYALTAGQFDIFKNNINNLSAYQGDGTVNGIYMSSGVTQNIYNNMISDLRTPNANSAAAIYGINLAGGTTANVSHNTIYLGNTGALTSSGALFGGAGVNVAVAVALELKNNIINIDGAGIGSPSGYFSALKRASGTAAVKPANVNATNNIYHAQYIYGEGNFDATATNLYHTGAGLFGTLDAALNTGCSVYKSFMLETGTFTENNLTTVSTGVFAPAGGSYAESGATGTTIPAITDDYSGVLRGSPADIGALEFAGSSTDAAGPDIIYTNLPSINCSLAPTLVATISDFSGVNTLPTTAPRMYYKKSTENNVLAATNTSADNGWKFVESSSGSSPFSFPMDFSLLTSAVTAGDIIEYFVIAEDQAGTPNVGFNQATPNVGFCPTTVDLSASAFPMSNYKSFTVLNIVGTATASPSSVCSGNNDTLSVIFSYPGTAQTGSGTLTSTTYTPYYGSTTAARRIQMLYTATELQALGLGKGNITGLSFDITSVASFPTITDLTIKIGMTTITTLPTTFSPAASNVVYGPATHTAVTGENYHAFGTPFYWDGVSNIVVEVCHGIVGVAGIMSARYSSGLPAGSMIYTTSNLGCAAVSGTSTTARTNIKFYGQISKNNEMVTFAWDDGNAPVGANNDTIIDQPGFLFGNPMTYSVLATDANGCTFTATTLVSLNTTSPSISSASLSTSSVCFGDSVTVSVSPADGCPPYSLAYTFTPTAGSPVALTLSATNKFLPTGSGTLDVTVTDNSMQTVSTTVGSVSLLAPPTATGDTRCGTGPVTLTATGTGSDIIWYDAPVGGTALAIGSPFTPTVSTTTNYYVATGNATTATGGRMTNVAGSALGASPRGVIFNTTSALIIDSIGFLSPGVATTITVQLYNSAGNATIGSPISISIPSNSGTPTVPILQTFPVNLAIPAAGTYRIFVTAHGTASSLFYESSGVTGYPYAVGSNMSITSSVTSLTGSASLTTYYYFYKFVVTEACTSARTLVTATVTPPPTLAITPSGPTTGCASVSVSLDAQSASDPSYVNFTWSDGVNSSSGPIWAVNPTSTTTYTVTADDGTVNGCIASATQLVTINPLPAVSPTANPSTICAGSSAQLDAGTFLSSTLTTPNTGATNSSSATGFDITNTSAVPVTLHYFSFQQNSTAGTVANQSVYYNPTPMNCVIPTNITTAPGWVLIGTVSTTSAGPMPNPPTQIPLDVNITIPPGATYAFAVGGASQQYFNGSSGCPVMASTPHLSVKEGFGGTFTSTIAARRWNGSVTYDYGNPNLTFAWTETPIGSTLDTNYIMTPLATPTSTTAYQVLVTDGLGCTNTGSTTVNVLPVPPAPTATGLTQCGIVSASLTATGTGGTIRWYDAAINGTLLATGSTYNTPPLNTSTDFWVEEYNGVCSGPRTMVSVVVIPVCSATLTLNAFIQGYYRSADDSMTSVLLNQGEPNGFGTQASTDCDTIIVELHDANSPYAIAFSDTVVLGTNGTAICTFPAAAVGNSYYIGIRNRTAVETWSASPVLVASNYSYDFRSSDLQAYGANMIQVNTLPVRWALFSGDIDQTGGIDGDDFNLLDPDIQTGNGGYLSTDLDGSGGVDGDDFNIFDPNNQVGVGAVLP
ncbi:MAG: hypothetical protein JNJ58_02815 [Chitinophagaceae bacterium]|nr:hypothetical protein [Chitinophagaceae bacterium]